MISLIRFILERAPGYVIVPIGAALWGGFAATIQPGWLIWSRGLVATCLTLLVLRIFDDLHSIEEDRKRKPDRGLVKGTINATSLRWTGTLLIAVIVLVLWQWLLAVATLSLCLYYAAFFRLRKRLPLFLKPWFSNAMFLLMPGLGNFFLTRSVSLDSIVLGGFIWLAAIAHEYGHNVRRSDEPNPGPADYNDLVGARGVAGITTLLFIVSGGVGLLFGLLQDFSLGFLVPFALAGLFLAKCCFDLLRAPSTKTAKPIYIAGFVFFLLPMLGFAVQQRFL